MNQLCKVCGEPAAGFHFGAFTCEGCKSFFGRTYNNLSQIHDCKNGGACVINKQNRTSCKACRLRKCLIVGMSKSGSRYGRRSNWFKIHCLLQEQAQFTNQVPQNFRTPATPTLQDGSLPFVATHLRDPISGLDTPINPGAEISTPNTSISFSTHPITSGIGSNCGMSDLPRLSTTFPSRFSPSQIMSGERRLHDVVGVPPPRSSPMSPSLDGSYRDHLLSFIQRTHGIDPLLGTQETDGFDDSRRLSPDIENRLGPMAFLEWKRRLREATKRSDVEVLLERKNASSSPSKEGIESLGEEKNEDCRIQGDESKLRGSSGGPGDGRRNDSGDKPTSIKNGLDIQVISSTETKNHAGSHHPHHNYEKGMSRNMKNTTDILVPEDDRLAFLKNSTAHQNSFRYGRLNHTLRFPGREDLLYNPVNNNLFSFPPYPPLWPPMIPFTPFSKLYPPFCPPRLQSPVGIDALKAPPSLFPLLDTLDHRLPLTEISKEDPAAKKRTLEAFLEYQREDGSPCGSPRRSPSVPHSVGMSLPVSQSATLPTTVSTSASSSEQPIDLTVRRKRKRDKSEIVYMPGEDMEELESDVEKEILPKEEVKVATTEQMEVKVSEIDTVPTCTSPVDKKFEVPIKLIKLEAGNETLTV